jgi:type VI secretion system protein ImpJ
MNDGQKVLWREGLFLTPQHFQANDRYCEWLSAQFSKSLYPYFWGISRLEIDEDAIGNRQFNVKRLTAILQDGTLVDCPGTDQRPAMRSFEPFLTPEKKNIIVYVAVASEDLERPSVAMPDLDAGTQAIRYDRLIRSVNDAVTGTRPREVEFLTKRLEIRFEGESAGNYDLLPLTRIEMKGAGRPALVRDFLPPCISMRGSALWVDTLNAVLQDVIGLVRELRGKLAYSQDRRVRLTVADLSAYFPAQILVSHLPELMHMYANPECHPYRVFSSLSQLAAQLSLLVRTSDGAPAEELPPYFHDSCGEPLIVLKKKLDEMLKALASGQEPEFALSPVDGRDGRWQVNLAQARFSDLDEFYLWISSDLDPDRVKAEAPLDFKLGAPAKIDYLVVYAVPGTPLTPVFPPAPLPAVGSGVYFKIDRNHEYWREVTENRQLVVATAQMAKYSNLRMRFHVIRA